MIYLRRDCQALVVKARVPALNIEFTPPVAFFKEQCPRKRIITKMAQPSTISSSVPNERCFSTTQLTI